MDLSEESPLDYYMRTREKARQDAVNEANNGELPTGVGLQKREAELHLKALHARWPEIGTTEGTRRLRANAKAQDAIEQ